MAYGVVLNNNKGEEIVDFNAALYRKKSGAIRLLSTIMAESDALATAAGISNNTPGDYWRNYVAHTAALANHDESSSSGVKPRLVAGVGKIIVSGDFCLCHPELFAKPDAALASPDIQFHFLPAAMRYDGKKPIKGHGFMVLTGPNKPKSRGHVRALSSDMRDHPDLFPNYLGEEEDQRSIVSAMRLARRIADQPPWHIGADVDQELDVLVGHAFRHGIRSGAQQRRRLPPRR